MTTTAHKPKPGPRKKDPETFVAVSPSTGKPLPRKQQPTSKGPGHSKGGDKPTPKQIRDTKPVKPTAPKQKPTSRPSQPSGGSGGGSAPSQSSRYHSVIPGDPTHDTSYTPDSAYAQQVMQSLRDLKANMSQADFAQLMQTHGIDSSTAGANGVMDQQVSTGTGQMGFQIGYTVDGSPSQQANLGAGGNINVPTNGSVDLHNILTNPPNPGNFPGGSTQYPGGGGIPSPSGGNNGFGQAPPRPGSGGSGIHAHPFLTTQATPTDTRTTSPNLPASTNSSQPTNDPNDPNALTQLESLLGQWGLGGLTGVVMDYLQQGYDSTSIQYLLTQSPEYKRRFSGNDQRIANGLGALSPAEYLATERAYQDVLRSAGLPAGFYDSPDDFAQWIAGDVSPQEIQSRVNDAVHFAQSTDPTFRTALAAYYGIDAGHIAAYFLDNKRAMPLIQKQANAADIGAAALSNGLSLTDMNDALKYADNGVTSQQARQAYGTIGTMLPQEQLLAAHFGKQYSQRTAEQELLGNDSNAATIRRRLNNDEQALFGGSSGVGNTALSTATAGAY